MNQESTVLADKIKNMPPAEQLRLAAGLLEAVAAGADARHLKTARALVDMVSTGICVVLMTKGVGR